MGANIKFPFFDTLVKFNNDSFSTDLHRKRTFTGLCCDFGSLTPHAYKANLVRSLILRAYNICSIYFSFHLEQSHIKGRLKGNSFPISLIHNVIKSPLDNVFSNEGKKPKTNEDKPTLFLELPF